MMYYPTLGRLFGWPEVVSEEGNIEVLFVLEERQSPKVIELIKCRNDKKKKRDTQKELGHQTHGTAYPQYIMIGSSCFS